MKVSGDVVREEPELMGRGLNTFFPSDICCLIGILS